MLKPDGTWLVVEPAAADDMSGNMNPVGRVYYNFSTLLCVPNALSQSGGYSLGAQAGEAAIRQIASDAGFTQVPAGSRGDAIPTKSTKYGRRGREKGRKKRAARKEPRYAGLVLAAYLAL